MDEIPREDGVGPSRAEETRPPFGFGVAKIGHLPTKAPIVTAILILLASVVAVVGAARVNTDDALSDLFRSKTPVYQNYRELVKRFPASESELFLVIEGKDLLDRAHLEELRALHLELNFAEAVSGVTSIFTIRESPDEKGYPPPIFPADLPEGDAYQKLIERAEAHPLIKGRLLSDQGDGERLALFVVSLKPEVLSTKGLKASIKEIEDTAREILGPTGLKIGTTGAPVMRMELVESTKKDRLIFNTLGFCVGFVLCLFFFRQLPLVVVANIAPVFSVLWSLALLGYWGMSLNPLNTTIMPLVMVITFTDSMHLTFSIKRQIEQGEDRFEAARHAVSTVGPACALTSLTTSIAFLSLMLTDSELIRNFGITAAASTILAFLSVIIIVPTLAVLLLRNEKKIYERRQSQSHGLIWLEESCEWIAGFIGPRSQILAATGLALVVLFTVLYLNLKPYYRLSDIVPDGGQAAETLEKLDEKLAGVHPLYVMIEWPKGESVYSEKNLAAIADTEKAIRGEKHIGNVWSADVIRRWLGGNETASPKELDDYMAKLPKHLPKRFLNSEERSALVTGYIPDLKAHEILGLVKDIKSKIEPIKTKYPDLTFTVTGLPILSAARSVDIIAQLNISLLGAVVVVLVLIGAAFRSVLIAALCVVPNLFALVATGGLLYFFGNGLEYSSVVALTVAFGLAVDDTIHFLNRLRLEQRKMPALGEAIHAAIIRIGPVLILTTVVLLLGISVTGLSELPPIRLFGQLCIVTLIFALIGDLIFLPAILLTADRFGLWPAELEGADSGNGTDERTSS